MLTEPRRIIDLSLDVFPGAPTFPGDPPCEFAMHTTVATTGYNLTRVCLGTHQGTHLDAPRHFFDGGRTVDNLDPRRWVGPAPLVDLSHKRSGDAIDLADLAPFDPQLRPGARLLYRVGWDRLFPRPEYFGNYPGLTLEAAEWLATRPISLLGMDTPGPHPSHWQTIHEVLLAAEIVIVEGLAHLDQLPPGDLFFVAAPLRLRGLDGSPVRALAILDY